MLQNQDGGAAVVRWLKAAGVRHAFSVSGGPINPIYRACADFGLPLIHTRHEAAACFMAEAAYRVTGNPGAVVVTLGPGATNTVTPAMVAALAGTPLVIIAAQTPTKLFERGGGMAFDPLPIMASVTKWSARVFDVDRIEEYLDIAWRKMWAGRPGPVFLEIPADIMAAPLSKVDSSDGRHAPPTPLAPAPSQDASARLLDELAAARRPLLLLGDECFGEGNEGWKSVVQKFGLPFSTMRLARGVVDERHALWIGPGYTPCNGALRRALKEADRVFLVGHHFEFDLDFGDSLGAQTRVVQIASDPELLHRNRRADLAIAAAPRQVIDVFAEAPVAEFDRVWISGLCNAWVAERNAQLGENGADGALHPVAAIDAVAEAMPDSTIFVTSHGNVDFWADARLQLSAPGQYLRAGQSGALGAELPYGVGAAFAAPDNPVIVFVGDGGVGFHVSELDTAERYDRRCIIVVLDDEMWGAIALPQEELHGTTYEMDLPRRDWGKVAEGLGCRGYLCRTQEDIRHAVRDAMASGKPALVQVAVRSVISPYMDYIS